MKLTSKRGLILTAKEAEEFRNGTLTVVTESPVYYEDRKDWSLDQLFPAPVLFFTVGFILLAAIALFQTDLFYKLMGY